MTQPFFPDPVFGWTFYLVLVSILGIAAYTDSRTLIVPKWLTLSGLGLGAAFNLIRGAWLGGQGGEAWIMGANGLVVGAVDGLCFAVAGLLLGFGLFFGMWVVGICGGGDVKLFAALSAWVGPTLAMWLLGGSVITVAVIAFGRLAWAAANFGFQPAFRRYSAREGTEHGRGRRPRQRLVSYSLPLALAAAVVLLWAFRVELRVASPREAASAKVLIHER